MHTVGAWGSQVSLHCVRTWRKFSNKGPSTNFVVQLLSFEVKSYSGSLPRTAMLPPCLWCSLPGWLYKQYNINAETEPEQSEVV